MSRGPVDPVARAEGLYPLIERGLRISIIGMIILAGLNGGERGDAAVALADHLPAAGGGLAREDRHKHGRGVVLDALAEPLLAARPPSFLVELILPGSLGQAGHGSPIWTASSAAVRDG